MKDDFNVAIRDVKLIEKDFRERFELLEQQQQIGVWSGQMQQTDLVKNMQVKVNKFSEELTVLYKNINELKAVQTLGSGLSTNVKMANDSTGNTSSIDKRQKLLGMPDTVKEVYGFWAITRQYFDDQARDFI